MSIKIKREWWIALLGQALLALFAAASAYGGVPAPTFTKVFGPDTIGPGSVSTLTFTVVNNDTFFPLADMAFTDTLPAGVTIADPANAATSCGVDAVLSAPDGGTTISFSDGRLAASGTCTVRVDVTSSTPGTHMNTSSVLTSDHPASGTATDDLTVDTGRPGFSKGFAPSTIALGGRSTLTFIIDNTANASNVTGLDFTDTLPAGLVIASPSNASTTCGGFDVTLTATPGTNFIALDADGIDFGGFQVVLAGATCTVTVDVTATGGGSLHNVSSELFSNPGFVSCGKASATLEVTITTIALVKKFLGDPVPPGGSVLLELTVNNFDRDFTATDVAFTDDLKFTPSMGLTPVGLPLMGACGAGSTLSETGGVLSLTGGTVAPESFCVFSVTLDVPAGETIGVYTNTTGAVTATLDGGGVVGNAASDNLFVEPAPVLTKEFRDATTLAPDPVVGTGDDVVMRFTVTNTSATSSATDVTFLDDITSFLPFPVSVTLPSTPCGAGSSVGLVSCGTDCQALELANGTLAAAGMAGDSCTFDVPVVVPVGLAAGVYVNTTEEVTATVDGATRTGNAASDDFLVVAPPALLKEFTDDPAQPGGTVTLEFTLTHDEFAPGDASGVTFTDNLASAISGLAATGLPLADLCGPGNGSLTGSAGNTFLTVTGVTLMPDEACTFSVTLDVPASATPGDHTNTTGSVTATVLGATATGNPASDDLKVAGLALSKAFTDDPALPGGTVTLEFTIDNLTPADDATGIFFTDNLDATLDNLAVDPASVPTDPCGSGSSITLASGDTFLFLSGGSLLAGETCTFSLTLDVPAAAADDTYTNVTSSLSATLGGSSFIGDPAVDELTVDSDLLSLTKEFTDDPAVPGESVNLRFTLTNLDPAQAASAIAFTDDLGAALTGLAATGLPFAACGGTVDAIPDAGTIDFSGGSLAAGATCFFDVTVSVPAGAPLGTTAVNTTSAVTGTIGGLGVSGDPATDGLRIDAVTFTKAFDGPTTATGTAVLTFTLENESATDPISDLSFTDDLSSVIAGLAASGLPATPCGAGSSIAGSSLLTFSSGNLPAGGMCAFAVTVTVPGTAVAGTFPNVTSDLKQLGVTVAAPATADLTIEPPPTFAKGFAPAFIGLGQTSTLTFTIDNSASALAASLLAFTDTLPAGVTVSNPPVTSNSCGGTLTAAGGSGTLSLAGGTVGAGMTCVIQVSVTGTGSGVHVNVSGDLTSTSGNSGTASDTLTVNPQPGFTKVFAPNPIPLFGTSTLTFTIDNTGSSVDATSLAFTDTLPAGLEVASPPNASTTCTGGTLTAAAGSSSISYSGGTVSAGASCTITVDVAGLAVGDHVNTSGALTSSLGSSGTAGDTLTVLEIEPPVVTTVTTARVTTPAGPLADCDTIRLPIADFRVTIADDLTPILGAGDPDNYLLVEAGPDGDFSTAACPAAAGDDVEIEIVTLSLVGADPLVVNAQLRVPGGLDAGMYRLFVCDTITDSAGNALDGDGDSVPGGDFVVPFFRADPGNVFVNGHFDDCPVTLAPWVAVATAPNLIDTGTPGADDAFGSPLSASARLSHASAAASGLAQCVAVEGGRTYGLSARVRFEPAAAARARFRTTCEFFSAAACAGSSLGVSSVVSVLEDEGGAWIAVGRQVAAAAGAASASCGVTVRPSGTDPNFDLYVDALTLDSGAPSAEIFTDGFESGDLASWSSSMP